MSTPQRKIFISHAAKDKDLAEKIVDVLLNNGCDVPVAEIFCTSLEGMGIPAGAKSFIDFIREKIQSPSLVILLLTENYFCSTFCQCELGATWALDLPYFPLVVPPLKKSELKATLAVTQAGDINDRSYLDELRDAVKEKHGVQVKTARWNVKKDLFLKELPGILAKLSKPERVPAAKLQEAERQYQEALQELEANEKAIEKLHEQIGDLEMCKDVAQVKVVKRKYSSLDEEFDAACETAKDELMKIKRATRYALYRSFCGGNYVPEDDDEWDDARAAAKTEEITDEAPHGFTPNTAHPRVKRVEKALAELESVVKNAELDSSFCEAFEKEHDFPLSFTNSDFWATFLVPV